MTSESTTLRERELEGLFGEYLAAVERGVEREDELVARAGALADDLRARIHLERELRALGPQHATRTGPEAAPQQLGRFRILGLLGKGGISTVYLAHDPELGRRVALKVLNRESLLDKTNRAWMLNEARALAQIEHPSVVRVHEVGETGTHTYLAMELVTGPSLRAVLDLYAKERRGEAASPAPELAAMAARLAPFSTRTAMLRQLADALAACHDRGVLHRDIKPHNVLFDAAGVPKLIDFGLAHDAQADEDSRIGLTQNLVGTAAYLAPEQVSGNETGADPRSDQFSFGVVAYECFALENPFQKGTQRATMAAVEAAEAPALGTKAPAIAHDLALVIHHALEREPQARYPDLRALECDLAAVLEHRPVTVEEPSLAHVARLWFRRHRRRVLLTAWALALLLTAGVAVWVTTSIAERSGILGTLRTIDARALRAPVEFERAYDALITLREQAREFDRSRLHGLFGSSVTEAVGATVEVWSRRLDESFRENEAAGVLQENAYRRLFILDELLCPTAPWNETYRSRGRVDYGIPEGFEARLEFLVTKVGEAAFAPVGRTTSLERYPIPGIYRLLLRRPGNEGIEREAMFHMPAGWLAEIRLEPGPRAEVFERAVACATTWLTLSARDPAQEVPSFRITPRVVSVAEFRAFLAATGAGYSLEPVEKELRDEDPAFVSADAASAYCRFAGGRLPFHQELWVADDSGLLEPAGPLAFAEFVLDPPTRPTNDLATYLTDVARATYRAELANGGDPSQLPISPAPHLDVPPVLYEEFVQEQKVDRMRGCAFRVAFSTDSWETYERLSEFRPTR